MTIASTNSTTELLISALATGDGRIQYSFRKSLDRASRTTSITRREELDALAGILDGLDRMDDAKTLEPTLRHLLTRVL